MCLAIVKPKGIQVPRAHLQCGWQHNPDGAGYSFVKDGKVVFRKGYMKLKDFLNTYEVDEATNQESNFLIHFRITSQGSSTADNTHPFPIEGGALIHNGTLTGTGSKFGVGPSDTSLFANMFSKNLTYDFVQTHKSKLNLAIRGSKIATLYDDGSYQIINEDEGHWDKGVWYSNYSYKDYKALQYGQYLNADWEDEGELPWQ